jgi:hypothetical protein
MQNEMNKWWEAAGLEIQLSPEDKAIIGPLTRMKAPDGMVGYPLVCRAWCSDHWRPPESVKMTSNVCCDDVWWGPYPGTSQRNHDHQCSKSLV